MSAMAEKARAAMREKASKFASNEPSKPVDASGYKTPGPLNGNVQTGMRPVSRRQFRHGGVVHGAHAGHAGRMPRASGGKTDAMDQMWGKITGKTGLDNPLKGQNPNYSQEAVQKEINKDKRIGKSEAARIHRLLRGPYKEGGLVAEFDNRDEKESNRFREGTKNVGAMKSGGAAHGKGCSCSDCTRKAHKSGGAVLDGGTRPVSGRLVRKSGGRTKGKTNVNIIIAQAPPQGGQPMPPPGMPPGGPPGMHIGAAPPMPPAQPGSPAPMSGGMPRKSGGRAYPIKHAAGGGEGRLEKIRAYGAK